MRKDAVGVGELGESPQNEKNAELFAHRNSFLEARGDDDKRNLGPAAALYLAHLREATTSKLIE
jgi:hypothetical protein